MRSIAYYGRFLMIASLRVILLKNMNSKKNFFLINLFGVVLLSHAQIVNYDGVCPEGATRWDDCDCLVNDFPNANIVGLKDTSEYAKVIYIDPDAEGGGDGSYGNPYNSWEDISTFYDDYAYVQKRGTTDSITSTISIPSSTDSIYFGAYSEGTKPIIHRTDTGKVIDSYSKRMIIRDLSIRNHSENATVGSEIIYLHGSCDYSIVYNCEISYGYIGIFTWASNNRIINNKIHNMHLDGIWTGEASFIEISHNNIYLINRAYDIDPDKGYAGGDGIQFAYNWSQGWIHNNIVDRSTEGNKFCLAIIPDATKRPYDQKFIIEFNTFTGPPDDGGGGATAMLDSVKNSIIQYNHLIGVEGTVSDGIGLWLEYSDNDTIIGNIFENYSKAVQGASPSLNAVISNNTFYNNNYAIYNTSGKFFNNIFSVADGDTAVVGSNIDAEDYNMFNLELQTGFTGNNSFVGNPHYTDSLNGDFRLQSNSDAINKAVPLPYYKTDITGARISDTTPDVGAYEFFGPQSGPVNRPPSITDQEFIVKEEEQSDQFIGRIIANDDDGGQKITFSIEDGNESNLFSLEASTGDLSLTTKDVFNLPVLEYDLLIKVKDDAEVTESSTANVNVVFVPETPEPDPIPTVYIDPGNTNDNLEDGSPEHPFNSWSDVSWEEGYQYLQKRGTTSEETKISIYAGNVTLGAYGEGDKPVIQSSSEESAIKFFNKTDISIKNLRIIAEKAISCIYIYGEESDRNRVGNCTLEGAENGIRAIDGKSVTICYNTITNCTDAIYSYAEDNTIYYNVFKFNIKAINITSSLSGSKIYNNVFYENGTGVSNSYSDLTLHNNIFYLASAGDVALNQEMDELLSDNNIFYPEREGFIAIGDYSYSSLAEFQENKGIDLNSFCRDPLFVDVYNDNFDLEYTSPAIDAGTMVGLEFDFLGNQVPLGGAPDIGIIEKNVNGTTSNRYFLLDNEETEFSVFPNPTSGLVNVSCKEASGQSGDLYIKDITGKTVYMGKFYSRGNNTYQTIDISDFPGGLYVLFVQFADKLYSHRILRTN